MHGRLTLCVPRDRKDSIANAVSAIRLQLDLREARTRRLLPEWQQARGPLRAVSGPLPASLSMRFVRFQRL